MSATGSQLISLAWTPSSACCRPRPTRAAFLADPRPLTRFTATPIRQPPGVSAGGGSPATPIRVNDDRNLSFCRPRPTLPEVLLVDRQYLPTASEEAPGINRCTCGYQHALRRVRE